MNNSIIFTGLPRFPEKFKRSVSELTDLDCIVDDIIFVTWKGYLDDESDLRRYLESSSVEIIESEESPVSGSGNIWHQMKALEIGLRSIPDNSHVLKTRTDVHIKKEFMKKLFSGSIDWLHRAAGSGVFDRRIWVSWFIISNPFCINDQCFYGTKQDLYKLVNYSKKLEVYDYSNNAHVIRFFEPYLKEYNFLRDIFKYESVNERYINEYELHKRRINSPVYNTFLSFYYKVMLNDFYVSHSPVTFYKQFAEGPARPPHRPVERLNDDCFLQNFTEEYGKQHRDQWINRDTGNIFCYRTKWLTSHFGKKRSQDIPQGVLKGLNRSFAEWKKHEINEKRLNSDIADETGYKEESSSPDQKQISHILNRINDANKIRQHEGYYSLLLKSAQLINSSIRDKLKR